MRCSPRLPGGYQVDGLPHVLTLAARALYRKTLSGLNASFAQRGCLRAKLEPYGTLKLVFYDRYDHQLSNAVPRSPFYKLSGVESMKGLNFEHVKIFKISHVDSKAPIDPKGRS